MKRMVTWKATFANGKDILVSVPKMPRSKVKAMLEQDAKNDGTTLVSFTDKHNSGNVL
tara:strand:+ start:91 stop:264 length:174 start_codon:yes stop_codon:yes gene_type:complete